MGYPDTAYWLDVGTPEAFVRGSCDLVLGRLASPALPGPCGDALVLPGAVRRAGRAGDGRHGGRGRQPCRARARTCTASVLFDGAVIGAGARVSGSVVGSAASVGEGAVAGRRGDRRRGADRLGAMSCATGSGYGRGPSSGPPPSGSPRTPDACHSPPGQPARRTHRRLPGSGRRPSPSTSGLSCPCTAGDRATRPSGLAPTARSGAPRGRRMAPGTLRVTAAAAGGPADSTSGGRRCRRDCGQRTAWGPGAAWLLDALPGLLGAQDDPAGVRPGAPAAARPGPPARRRRGSGGPAGCWRRWFRRSSSRRSWTQEAHRAWRLLLLRFGDPAPGPAPAGLRVFPPAQAWLRIPSWEWHRAGVEAVRARTIAAAARVAGRLEEIGRHGPGRG